MIEADPSGRFVLHTDLGLDRIYIWKLDEQTGKLVANDPASIALPPGDGPRHFAFHPNGKRLYSLQEEASNVVFFNWDSERGNLESQQTISTLPPGFGGSSFGSEIMVSADGRFVYAGNRLYDSVAIFSVGESGKLSYLADEWTRGNYPRSFNVEPSGEFFYVCNQRADNIACFRIDGDTGALQFTGQFTPVGNPSIIVFADLALSTDGSSRPSTENPRQED